MSISVIICNNYLKQRSDRKRIDNGKANLRMQSTDYLITSG